MRRRQSRRWWTNTPWNKELGEGSEQCWVLYWVFKEGNLLPGTKQNFYKMPKGSILYVGGQKPGPCTNVWRWQVLQVLHCKVEGDNYGANNVMLLRQMK